MNDRLYKQQTARMRPIEHPEFTWWEDTKIVGAFIGVGLLLLGGLAGISFAVLGLFR